MGASPIFDTFLRPCHRNISLFQWIGNFTKQILDILLNKTASREEERLKKAQNL